MCDDCKDLKEDMYVLKKQMEAVVEFLRVFNKVLTDMENDKETQS